MWRLLNNLLVIKVKKRPSFHIFGFSVNNSPAKGETKGNAL